MGYRYISNGTIVVKAEHLEDALTAINALHDAEALLIRARGGRGGSGSENHPISEIKWYLFVNNPPPEGFKTLMEAFHTWHIFDDVDEAWHDEEGNFVYGGCINGKLGQEDIFLEAVAPFCKDTRIECSGEDGTLWLWEFRGGVFFERPGSIAYD